MVKPISKYRYLCFTFFVVADNLSMIMLIPDKRFYKIAIIKHILNDILPCWRTFCYGMVLFGVDLHKLFFSLSIKCKYSVNWYI